MTLCGDSVHLTMIPETPSGRTEYHNHLMEMCGLSLRELLEAMDLNLVARVQYLKMHKAGQAAARKNTQRKRRKTALSVTFGF